jgi:hypothetical protein
MKSTVFVYQIPPYDIDPQMFVVVDLENRWQGGHLGYCLEPGHHAETFAFHQFWVNPIPAVSRCQEWELIAGDHQNIRVSCDEVPDYGPFGQGFSIPKYEPYQEQPESTAVPSPGTFALILLGTFVLLKFWRSKL